MTDYQIGSSVRPACRAAFLLSSLLIGCGQDLEEGAAPARLTQQLHQPEEGSVHVASVTATGTGCPAGTWTSEVSADGQSVDVGFAGFQDELGAERSTSTKNCSVAIALDGAEGVSYAPQAIRSEGVSRNADARYEFSVYWSATPEDRRRLMGEAGPPVDDWGRSDVMRDLLSPCSGERTLRIDGNIEGALHQGHGTGKFGVSRTNVRFRTQMCEEAKSDDRASLQPTTWDATPEELPPSGLTIERLEAFGPGCPAGTAKVVLAPDGKNFIVTFDDYAITGGATASPICNLVARVPVPDDQAYAIESFVVSGHAQLPAESGGEISVASTFLGVRRELGNTQYLMVPGPYDGPFTLEHRVPAGEQTFSTCGGRGSNYFELYLAFRSNAFNGPQGARLRVAKVGNVKYAVRKCDVAAR